MNTYPDYQALSGTLESGGSLPLTTRGDLVTRDASDNIRLPIGSAGQVLTSDGTDASWGAVAGTGDVVGPASAVNNNLCSFDTTTGKLIADSGIGEATVVIGPASATDSAIPLYDTTTGKLLKDSTLALIRDVGLNTIFGPAPALNTGLQNTLLGDNSYAITDGSSNVVLGVNAGDTLTTGSNNTALGHSSLTSNLTGLENTAVGSSALALATGSTNTAVGSNAGNAITTGSNNVMVGSDSDGIAAGSNQTAIGYQAATDASNQIMLGNASVTEIVTNASASVNLGSSGKCFASAFLKDIAEPSNPADAEGILFKKTGDDGIWWKPDSAGTAVDLTASGFTDPMTTRGDIIVRDAVNATARLAIGTNGQVLTSDGTDISWATPASGFSDPMTTRGDIIIRDATNSTARLAVGAVAGNFLVSDGTDISWGSTLTLPKINDLSSNNTFNIVTPELTADRTLNLPLLTGNDTLTCDAHTSTLTNKTINTASNTLVVAGSDVSTGQVAIANGGTGAATATAGFDALAPTTTQGDIMYFNGTNNVRLAKGTASQVLTMNSGATAPEWAAAAGGGGLPGGVVRSGSSAAGPTTGLATFAFTGTLEASLDHADWTVSGTGDTTYTYNGTTGKVWNIAVTIVYITQNADQQIEVESHVGASVDVTHISSIDSVGAKELTASFNYARTMTNGEALSWDVQNIGAAGFLSGISGCAIVLTPLS